MCDGWGSQRAGVRRQEGSSRDGGPGGEPVLNSRLAIVSGLPVQFRMTAAPKVTSQKVTRRARGSKTVTHGMAEESYS